MVERVLIACVCFKYNSKVALFQPAKLLSVAYNAQGQVSRIAIGVLCPLTPLKIVLLHKLLVSELVRNVSAI